MSPSETQGLSKGHKETLTTVGALAFGSGLHHPSQAKRDVGDAQNRGEDGKL